MIDSDISEDDDHQCTPPDIIQKATEASTGLIPAKSRILYENTYDAFQKWKKQHKIDSSSERVLMAYFNDLSKKFAPPTLWAKYSMLRTTLTVNDDINIREYNRLIAFLKQNSKGYHCKKSLVFQAEEIRKFLSEAPDEVYLVHKVCTMKIK